MEMYSDILLKRVTDIDDILNGKQVKSVFECSGFFTPDNVIFHDELDRNVYEIARPIYNKFGFKKGKMTEVDLLYTGSIRIQNQNVATEIQEVKASYNPDTFPVVPYDLPHREEMIKLYIETMATHVTTGFDNMLMSYIVGNNVVASDKDGSGNPFPPTPPDGIGLASDSGRTVVTQTTDLKTYSADVAAKLMNELIGAIIQSPELYNLNDNLYVLLPTKAFLCYRNVFSVTGDVNMINDRTFISNGLTFVALPTVGFPNVTTPALTYNCAILPRSAIKFFLLVSKKELPMLRDPETNIPILDAKGEVQRPIRYSPFFVEEEQGGTRTTNTQGLSRGSIVTVAKKGTCVRYRPEFVQGWNIPDALLR